MKKWIYIIAVIFLQMQLVSCRDDLLIDGPSEDNITSLKIMLEIPVENAQARGLVYGPDEAAETEECTIKDIYGLAFDGNGQCISVLNTQYSSGMLSAIIDTKANPGLVGSELTVMVLTNLADQEDGSDLVYVVKNARGKSKAAILESLEYGFSAKWNIAERPLPMWGESTITPLEGQIVNGTMKLYRSVAKVNLTVNKGKGVKREDKDVFKLKSVRVYYARTSGLVGSKHAPQPNSDGSPTIIETSMPQSVSYMPRYISGVTNGILFEATTGSDYTIENKIYVPEVDQPDVEPMCLVVGGYYLSDTEETFYRVDFKQGNKGSNYYDAIRNHIYNFDITDVTRPGTDIPDEALDHVVVGMDLTIKEWTTEYMRGIGGQYTLEVEAGGVLMDATNQSENSIRVTTTHNEGWQIASGSQSGNWFKVAKSEDEQKVIITPNEENRGGQRRGSFVITSGNLRKVIMVRQKGKGTANCYVVSDDGNLMWQDLPVTVKGNGEDGLIADGKLLNDQTPNIAPTDVKVIWETATGLVQLDKNPDGTAKISQDGIVRYQIDLNKQNINIKNSNQNTLQGGNALIGAFDENGELLWSWHIWVCPDMDTSKDGIIDEAEIALHLQTWSTGYTFMDRNLGALSTKPGLASLGLLYQWGRKDPFIGAGSIAENASRVWTDNIDGYDWSVQSSMNVEDARKAPTTLCGSALSGSDYKLLWGTDKGFEPNGERNAGNKTIYDPCPVGYRVPPVGSVVFKSGGSSSENTNWNYNNRFWPNNEGSGYDYNYIKPDKTDSYGFWLNLTSSNTRPTVNSYSSSTNPNNATVVANATWLPITGVYDGNIGEFAYIDNQYSVTVNSIVWTNSSITARSEIRPGALFLHGAEDTSRDGSSTGNGRHIHKLIENSNALYAKPSHAGSVRCIKDDKSSIQNSIRVPSTITLGSNIGSQVDETLVSITETWEIEDPGASWFTMTPDAGGTGSAQPITFRATETNTGNQREAVLKIRFSDNSIREITVIQKGVSNLAASPTSLSFAGYSGNNNPPSVQNIAVTSNTDWKVQSNNTDWIEVSFYWSSSYASSLSSSGNGYFYIRPTKNRNGSPRTGSITITDGNKEIIISVSQSGEKEQ